MEIRSNRTLERIRAAGERTRRESADAVCFDPGEGADGTLETELFQFGRYEVVSELARGGAGVVYRAWDCQLERFAALKVMLSGTWHKPARVTGFLREARAAARLSDPGVVQVFDAGTTPEGAVWFAMALIEGPSLAEVIAERGALPTQEALALLRQVAVTLERVHQAGLVHRDIKPSNILLRRTGEPLLTDFGLVLEVDRGERIDASGPVGTPAYMAPEQAMADSREVDWYRADIYALGAVIYELLSGRQPPAFWHLRDKPLPPLGRGVPTELEAICRKAMSYEPAGRYGSVRELLDDLDRFEGERPVLAGRSSLSRRAWLFARRHRHTARTVAITAAVALAVWIIASGG